MATGKIESRGSESWVTGFLVPRPLTRFVLWGIGLGVAALAWAFLDFKLLAYVSGLAMPFCMVCATAAWAMRDKADEIFDGESLSAHAFKAARKTASRMRQRGMRRAALVAVYALIAGSPAISSQLSSAIWQWMVLLAGIAVTESIYSYLLVNSWDEQLRDWKDGQQIQQRERNELQNLVDRVQLSKAEQHPPLSGWTNTVGSLGSLKPH